MDPTRITPIILAAALALPSSLSASGGWYDVEPPHSLAGDLDRLPAKSLGAIILELRAETTPAADAEMNTRLPGGFLDRIGKDQPDVLAAEIDQLVLRARRDYQSNKEWLPVLYDVRDAITSKGAKTESRKAYCADRIAGNVKFADGGNSAPYLDDDAMVPHILYQKGAEGFTVEYPEGKIIDLGTEFAVDVPPGGGASRFGVFRGEIECRPNGNPGHAFRLLEGHAAMVEKGETRSIPFDKTEFVRELPSREFSWNLETEPGTRVSWSFDVSHLIYKPGTYLAICKTLGGSHRVRVARARLVLDGVTAVAEAPQVALLPFDRILGQDNAYRLTIPEQAYRRGKWSLHLEAWIQNSAAQPASAAKASGILMFEEGLVSEASAADFVGTWEYLHDGNVYRRSFLLDGSSRLTINGEPYAGFQDSRWLVREGNLILSLRDDDGSWFEETHCLRNHDTLIFINRPYRNALRLDCPQT